MAFQIKVRRGEAHPLALISNAQRLSLAERWGRREASLRELAEETGLSKGGIYRIVTNPENKTRRQPTAKKTVG